MINNLGTGDRILRAMVSLVFIAYAVSFGFPDTGWNTLGWLGFVPLLTAIAGYCPLYTLFGFSTYTPRP